MLLPAERARPARSRGGELESFPFKSENQALMREESLLMQNVNCESESDITSPCSEARHIAGRESATCAVTGRRARASSFSKSESRTSPREESLPMQHVINHKTARGSRSEERHIAGRESTTCAKEKEETPARPAGQQSRAPPGSPHAANHRKERSGVTSSAGDVTGFHHPVMPPLPP